MASNQTNTAQITILGIEATTNNVLVNRSFAPSLAGLNGLYGTYINNPAAGTVALPFPYGVVTLFNFYARNLASLGGGNISISVTFTGGAAQALVLTPGDVYLYWSNQNAVATAGIGITAVSVTNVAASTATFEYFMGA
jgi:hypothetical protein